MNGLEMALLALCLAGTLAKCPKPSELQAAGGPRVCARFYEDSNVLYDQCCGGGFLDIPSPSDVPSIQRSWNDQVSSLVVGPRCQLTVWNKRGKRGNQHTFRSGTQMRLVEVGKGIFGNWDDSISSYYCVCS